MRSVLLRPKISNTIFIVSVPKSYKKEVREHEIQLDSRHRRTNVRQRQYRRYSSSYPLNSIIF